MAKRKKTAPAKATPKRTKKAEVRLASLTPPNHLVPLEHWDRSKYPTMILRRLLGDRDDYLFMAKMHQPEWPDHNEHPPTWMDPEWFLKIALKDARVQALIARCLKLNSFEPAKKLAAVLVDIFQQRYLAAAEKKFQDGCAAALAEYLVAQAAFQAENQPPVKRKRRSPSSST